MSGKYKSKCIFLDLFSSSGANIVGETSATSIGSPIVSILRGVIPNKSKGINNRFHKWIFMELNPEFCEALQDRVEKTIEIVGRNTGEKLELGKDIEILCGDSNNIIDGVIRDIEEIASEENVSVLAFVDPYKFSNLKWNTFEKLLSLKYVDIIFMLPTLTLRRGIDECIHKDKYIPPTLLKLCSEGSFCDISDDRLGDIYAKDIAGITKRKIYYFDKGLCAKNSCNGEIYRTELFSYSEKAVKIAEDIVKRLESIDYSIMKNFVEQAQGKQKTLMDFFSK